MSLLTLIQKGGLHKVATATVATPATQEAKKAGVVATVAVVAVASPKNEKSAQVFLSADQITKQPNLAKEVQMESAADSWIWIEERAAIMETSGGIDRDTANHRAFMLWFGRFVGGENL